ncbi:hypothetical protein P8C59_007298 [Phyllachora maydis]|nr:hypothetical protein P8C59_007298 [Phyllachora maydis]
MVVSPSGKSIYVALLDRSICHYDLGSGRLLSSFKCTDEGGLESVVLESLVFSDLEVGNETRGLLFGLSNTDKSVRIYDAQYESFLDREWGHTEAINGIALLEGTQDRSSTVVSVGTNGTIMIWSLELLDPTGSRLSRDPSPEKVTQSVATRPPLRKVLSKAELAEFQRPQSASCASGRRSPPRLQRRASRFNLQLGLSRTPVPDKPSSPTGGMVDYTDLLRRASTDSRSSSPPLESPKNRLRISRRPSLPALNATRPSASTMAARKKNSTANLRAGYGFGSLSMATEQTCRQLRAYRKKLVSSEKLNGDVISELDAELRLTAAALGERAIRSRVAAQQRKNSRHGGGGGGGGGGGADDTAIISEAQFNGLLAQHSERIVSMLCEQLRLRPSEEDKDLLRVVTREQPQTAGQGSASTTP